ncbi:DUF389 domain-containing protein [Synechococcus elongatus]|uniref:DUF389 domain-containing protein n=1 Tax=Synechococcus elongatus PCC 11801 TaxID=2219813 RepID=A0AAN1UVL4_SYNEL|nr:DUF389 domain-containing protein [Synechococcus elongatus]
MSSKSLLKTLFTPRRSPSDIDRVCRELERNIRRSSGLTQSYLFLVVTSASVATLGLLANSVAVIIGAMLIAPVLQPLRGLALAGANGSLRLLKRAGLSLIVAIVVAITLSWFLGRLVALPEYGSEVLARTNPNLLDLGVAVVAGSVAAYASVKHNLSDAIAGTGIAVALMPPLATVGLTLAQGDWQASGGAMLLFLTNVVGIILAAIVTFKLMGVTRQKTSRGLYLSLFLTSLLSIPLGLSFWESLQNARLQRDLRDILLTETITVGRQVQLLGVSINWNRDPIEVQLQVRALRPVTPRQVDLVETFLENKLKRPVRLIFFVSSSVEVTSDESPAEETPLPAPPTPAVPAPEATPAPAEAVAEPSGQTTPAPEPELPSATPENP